MTRTKVRYGLGKFLLEVLLTICTGGLWLLFRVFRYMSRR